MQVLIAESQTRRPLCRVIKILLWLLLWEEILAEIQIQDADMTSLASFWSGKDRNRFVLDSQLLQTTLSIFQCIFCVHVYIFVWFVVSPHLGNPEISVFISCLQAEVLSIAHNSLIEVELVSTPFSYRRLFSFFVKISVCFELLPTLSICSSLKWLSIMVSKPLKRISSLLRQSGANGLTKRMYRKSPHISWYSLFSWYVSLLVFLVSTMQKDNHLLSS